MDWIKRLMGAFTAAPYSIEERLRTTMHRLPPPPRPAPPMPECKAPAPERMDVVTMAAGDTLIVTCDRALTRKQVDQIKAGTLDSLPAGCKVMVLHGGLKIGGTASAQRDIDESIARLDAHNLT